MRERLGKRRNELLSKIGSPSIASDLAQDLEKILNTAKKQLL